MTAREELGGGGGGGFLLHPTVGWDIPRPQGSTRGQCNEATGRGGPEICWVPPVWGRAQGCGLAGLDDWEAGGAMYCSRRCLHPASGGRAASPGLLVKEALCTAGS